MPDSSTKKLLVKLGISSTEWNKVVSQIKSQLADMNRQAVKDSEKVQALAKKESELQKQKLKDAKEELDVYDRKIKQVQKTIDVQELDSKQRKDALEKAKSLLALEQAHLNLISKQKEFRDVDLSKLKERIDLRKSELSVIEAQFRLEQPTVKLPAAGEMGAGRMAQLQAGLQRAQASTAMVQVKTEMATQAEAYRTGTIQTKTFVDESIALLAKKHKVIMEQIQQEKIAQEAAIAIQAKATGLPAEAAKMQTQIVAEQIKKQEIIEKQNYDSQVTRLNNLVKKEEQVQATRTVKLRTDVIRTANLGQQTQVQAQIAETERAYRTREIRLKEYVATETTLQNQLHALRLRAIENEKQAGMASVQAVEATGKRSAEDIALMIQKVELDINKLRIQADQARAEAVSGLPKTGLMATLTRGMEGREGGKGVGGILGGLTGAYMYGGMGGGLLGTVGGMLGSAVGPEGALLGGLVGGQVSEAISSIIEKIKSLGEAIEEASGKEAQLRVEFEKLSRGAVTDPEEFIGKLKIASRGLADASQLYQIANNFMRLGMHMTTEQIVELTRVTVDLSRESGRTADEGIQALINASRTGYMRTLASATGIATYQMRLRGLSPAISETARQQITLNKYLEIGEAQLKALGPPLMTLPEVLKIYHIAHDELIHDFASSVASSKGFSMAMGELADSILKTYLQLAPLVNRIGKDLGQALFLIAPMLGLFTSSLKLIVATGGAAINTVSSLAKAFGLFGKSIEGVHTSKFLIFIVSIAASFDQLSYRINNATAQIVRFAGIADAILTGHREKIADIEKQFEAATKQNLDDLNKQMQDLNVLLQEGDKPSAKITPKEDNAALTRMLQKAQLQIAQEAAKQKFEIMQEELDEEKATLKQHYEEGLVTLEQYVRGEKAILEQQKGDKIAELEEMRDNRIKELRLESADTMAMLKDNPDEQAAQEKLLGMKIKAIREQTATQILQITVQTNRQELASDNQLVQDKLAARRGYAAAVLELQKKGAEDQKKELESQLTGGEIAPVDYIAKRKALIDQELAITEQGLQAEYDASEKDEKAKEVLNTKTANAEMDAQNQLADLERKNNDIYLKAIEGKYDTVMKYYNATLRLAQAQAQQGQPTDQLGILKDMQEVVANNIKNLNADLERMRGSVSPISDDYIKVVTAIASAREEQIKLNEEIAKMKDYLGPVADLMSSVESSFSNFPGMKPLNLGGPIKTLQTISKFTTTHEGTDPFRALRTSVGGLFGKPIAAAKVTLSPMDQFKEDVASSASHVSSFSNTLTTAVTSLQTFSNALITVATSAKASFGPPDVTKMVPASTTGVSIAHGLPPNLGITPADVLPPAFSQISETAGGGYTMGVTRAEHLVPESTGGPPDISGLSLKMTNKNLGDLNEKLIEASGKKGNTGLRAFTDSLASAAAATAGALGTIAGSQNVGGGAVGGGIAMAGLGGSMAKMMSSSAAAGPIGMAVGATVGIVAGAIVGSKQHAVNENVKKLDLAFKNVVDSLNNGSMKIGDAINQMVGIREQAISQLGGSKKGQKQLPAVLQQMDQELISLQNQQRKIIKDMFDQIKTLSQPTAMQPIVQQLSDIVKQYQQYLSAASGTPNFVARAHQYMTLALQNYVTTMKTDLRSAQEDAISNALQLLDLEKQKAQMISQEAQQEYDIMTQGVLTRQRTIAQTKIGQIEQLRYEQALQLDQINQQIALAQYRMQAEQKIFGLTTDRISLEAQLLALKEQDANLQLLQITALQTTIGKLQAAMAAGLPWAALGAVPTTGTQGALDILQGMITPTSVQTNVTPNLETQMAQLYALRGRYGAGGFSSTTV